MNSLVSFTFEAGNGPSEDYIKTIIKDLEPKFPDTVFVALPHTCRVDVIGTDTLNGSPSMLSGYGAQETNAD